MPERVIDTHVHCWNFDQAKYPWLEGDKSILNRNYELAELEEARIGAGITEGLLVQAANNGEDTDWMLRLAAATPWIKGVVGWVPLQDPLATGRLLTDHYLPNPWFKGVRHLIHNETDPRWLLQDTVIESLSLLADQGLPYDIVGIIPAHITTALRVAEKVPGLRMVFDHLNQPPIGNPPGQWGELMKAAAGHNNFYMKISGLGTASGNFQGWKTADLEPYIGWALDHFGEGRCFCGGDWPVSLLAGSYGQIWEAYRDIIGRLLGEGGRVKVLYKNAQHFYKLNDAI
ncbi:MAG TPA: amidohydrolase family protein [Puia sp.]|nr:amidohydrolase family protein [Puia sp.]